MKRIKELTLKNKLISASSVLLPCRGKCYSFTVESDSQWTCYCVPFLESFPSTWYIGLPMIFPMPRWRRSWGETLSSIQWRMGKRSTSWGGTQRPVRSAVPSSTGSTPSPMATFWWLTCKVGHPAMYICYSPLEVSKKENHSRNGYKITKIIKLWLFGELANFKSSSSFSVSGVGLRLTDVGIATGQKG